MCERGAHLPRRLPTSSKENCDFQTFTNMREGKRLVVILGARAGTARAHAHVPGTRTNVQAHARAHACRCATVPVCVPVLVFPFPVCRVVQSRPAEPHYLARIAGLALNAEPRSRDKAKHKSTKTHHEQTLQQNASTSSCMHGAKPSARSNTNANI
jgi:hypothetical protein